MSAAGEGTLASEQGAAVVDILPAKTSAEREFTRAEVAALSVVPTRVLVILDNAVYDLTGFFSKHPGGEDLIIEFSGRDATGAFEGVGHSQKARAWAAKQRVGRLAASDWATLRGAGAVNVVRRTWDRDEFELKAKERADKEAEEAEESAAAAGRGLGAVGAGGRPPKRGDGAGEHGAAPVTTSAIFRPAESGAAGPAGSKRAFLQGRGDLQLGLESNVNRRTLVAPLPPASSSLGAGAGGGVPARAAGVGVGGYYCDVCDCTLKDSQTYLDHINGKKHQRKLGFSMRVESSTLDSVRARLDAHRGRDAGQATRAGLDDEAAKREAMAEYESRIEEQRRREEEERRRKRARRDEGGASSGAAGGASAGAGAAQHGTRPAAAAPASSRAPAPGAAAAAAAGAAAAGGAAAAADSAPPSEGGGGAGGPGGSGEGERDMEAEMMAMLGMKGFG